MKIFVRACSDCEEIELSPMITTLRVRLPVFLQSQTLEVQERASTFRHLLAEFDILSLDWEDATIEKANNDGSEKREDESDFLAVNLLDISDMYTTSSVQAVDDKGAREAMRRSNTLAAIISERFYAVHPKAQRRVPVPEGLDIGAAFNVRIVLLVDACPFATI
jgi:hypothetical protein